jgi:hypothetical protein
MPLLKKAVSCCSKTAVSPVVWISFFGGKDVVGLHPPFAQGCSSLAGFFNW